MPKRATIRDLANASGVSTSTVNRAISDPERVHKSTLKRIQNAAETIGFYGLNSHPNDSKEKHRPGILLQQPHRAFYRDLGQAFSAVAAEYGSDRLDLTVRYLEDLSPDHVSKNLLALSETCDSIALVAAEHPLLSDAIDQVLDKGIPVCGLVAPLSARGNVGYVGLDHWKVGRTAAWTFDKLCPAPGKIGILVGNHRYRNQELNESGFRSYFREHNSDFKLLEPLLTFESAAVGREMTEQLLNTHPDMCGLFASGGGITGVLAALRESKRQPGFVCVGYELIDVTRNGLIDGTLTLTISHPILPLARETISHLINARKSDLTAGAQSITLNFEIYTSENV